MKGGRRREVSIGGLVRGEEGEEKGSKYWRVSRVEGLILLCKRSYIKKL